MIWTKMEWYNFWYLDFFKGVQGDDELEQLVPARDRGRRLLRRKEREQGCVAEPRRLLAGSYS